MNVNCQRFSFVLIAGFAIASTMYAHGQIDCVEPRMISVAKIQGQVFDPSGVPISGASVILLQGDKPISKMKTDKEGKFNVESAEGVYLVEADLKPGFEAARFPLRIHRSGLGLAPAKSIRIVLGLPGRDCPWATTSEKEFRQEIRDNNKRMQGSTQKNAT